MSPEGLAALGSVSFNWTTSLDGVWTDEAPRNPDHNEEAYKVIYNEIGRLHRANDIASPLGRIIIGEGGAGKTYLAQLLHARVLSEGFHFVLVDCTDIRDFWETVLHCYIKSLQRPYQGKTQLEHLLLFLRNQIPDGKPPDTYVQEMGEAGTAAVLEHTDRLTQHLRPLLNKANETLGSRIVGKIIRALYLLNSVDEHLNDIGNSWLLGLGLENTESTELGLNLAPGVTYGHAQILKGLSWLMAQRAPSLVVLDQLDPIISESHFAAAITDGANDQQLRAKAIIEGLGGGLSRLYDNTYRTLSLVLALHNSWNILQATTLSSNLERFHPPLSLKPIDSSSKIQQLLGGRLEPAYREAGFSPPYPTYPFPNASLARLERLGLYPRQLLKRFAIHQDQCLSHGYVLEFNPDVGPIIKPDPDLDFSKLLAETAAQMHTSGLVGEQNEDELGRRLISLCEGLIHEFEVPASVTLVVDPHVKVPRGYPSLHARLRRIDHGASEREEHYCLRALEKSNHSAFRARLGAALTEAGIDQQLPFRHLVIIRNAAKIPAGAKTKEVYDKFIKAHGKVCGVSTNDLQVIEAVRKLIAENRPGFLAWLTKAKPLSNLPVVREAFAGLFAANKVTSKTAVESSPQLPQPTTATTAALAGESPNGTNLQPAKPRSVAEESVPIPIGRRVIGGSSGEVISLPIPALTKHTVIRAGSGGGKTVLVKRLIEEAALLGVSSIVLDPGNDLAWLSDPWPEPPAGWQEGDAEKAKQYFSSVEVVLWTPGKTQGRPLNLPLLPDLKAVADDKDALNDAVSLAQASLIPLCASGKSSLAIRKQGILTAALRAFAKAGGDGRLNTFIDFLSDLPPEGTGNLNNAVKLASEMADVIRASILNNPLLEESGQMLDIGMLLGLGRDKPRISVISFIGLGSLEAQQQFVNQLAMGLFTWIKKHPSAGPAGVTGLFVLDEAKDFLPGGSNTSPCKKSLMRLAAQARKYGLGMIVATQNPKDLDYNAVAQFATQFFGRANSPQVIDFIDDLLRAKGGSGEGVARLQKGQFYVTSSEGLTQPLKLRVPLCLSNHPDGRPLTEAEILTRAQLPIS
jgi:hypothetical protein